MTHHLTLGIMAALALPLGAARLPQRGVELAVARFQRVDGTLMQGRCRVPFALVQPLLGGESGAYGVQVIVRDSTGLALVDQSWTQTVPGRLLRVYGASAVEHFRFRAAPGSYQVELAITDSASGLVRRSELRVAAFDTPPAASDLLLTSALRQVPDSVEPGPGEIRMGQFLLAAQVEPTLTLMEPHLYYYQELYPGRDTTVVVTAAVVGEDGTRLIATRPESVVVAAMGAVSGGVDLTGLPPGQYRLEVAAAVGATTHVRHAPFRMAGFETQAAVAAAAVGAEEDVFAPLTEDQLDTLYAPLVYLLEGGEGGVYGDLSVEGKRTFLRTFWARRDPTPATPRNETQEEFYRLIAQANQLFREGGAAEVPGWRTDRGRIYIRYGEPDEVLRRPQATQVRPYEAWKYTTGRFRKFVFQDETGFGHYRLIYTNERREPSLPDWQQRLGPEGVQDFERF